MVRVNKTVKYNFYHWGPFLYKTCLDKEEIEKIKNLCSKNSKDYRTELAGLIRHEYVIDVKKIFPIISYYFESYLQAYSNYGNKHLTGNKIELISSWVNYMTKFESNPLHTHDDDLSFVIFTEVPEILKQEVKDAVGNTRPGAINFIHTLGMEKYNVNQHTFMPEVGDFFIFPASLHHYVNHFQSDGERISVSGNIKITNG
jgi:hypothetical protein|tara:strand:- start:36 stop:638 length:603 start_codon:yes stop_codon:yes gene_type:complete